MAICRITSREIIRASLAAGLLLAAVIFAWEPPGSILSYDSVLVQQSGFAEQFVSRQWLPSMLVHSLRDLFMFGIGYDVSEKPFS